MKPTYSTDPARRATQQRRAWTDDETAQLCGLYLAMLQAQQAQERFVKAPAVRALAEALDRSRGSIEAKLMNVSGVLADAGLPWVKGYKPLRGYGKSMVAVVLECVAGL